MALDQYRGYRIRTDYTVFWTATIFSPGSSKPHPVVIRATGAEGEAVAIQRAIAFIDTLRKEIPPKKRG